MNRNTRQFLVLGCLCIVMLPMAMGGGSNCTTASLDTDGRSCLDATEFEGKFTDPSGANATTSDFSGDYSEAQTGPNITVKSTSGNRKILFIVPNLNTATYDLSSVYLSYTETVGDKTNVWKATSGTLRILQCTLGLNISTTPATMSPFVPGNSNAAAGTFKLAIFKRKQI